MPHTIASILNEATNCLAALDGQTVNLIEVERPTSLQYALELTKIISKLSPMLGNLFEFRIVDILNSSNFVTSGEWIRQDPGFPDARYVDSAFPDTNIGVEVKAWFPFATEITGRFKDSEDIFKDDSINVAIVAWLPESVFWGKPKVIKTLVISGRSIAQARDQHYHNPPHYIVLEPEDTSARTGNLQQTNTNGYVFQHEDNPERKEQYAEALRLVDSWGELGRQYSTSRDYQALLKNLQGQFPYRLDTNYAKIDRIEHSAIESFKESIFNTTLRGKKIKEWRKIAGYEADDPRLIAAIQSLLEQA